MSKIACSIEDCFVRGHAPVTTYPEVLCSLLASHLNAFRVPEDGLWWHGLFVKRDGSVTNNGVKWARGNGWLLLAISSLLLRTDEAFTDRDTLTTIFLGQLQNLLQYQRSSGAFGNIVNVASSPDESSLVSVYIFSVGVAARLGLLSLNSDEAVAAEKAWNWLLQRTYANLTLSDTNAGQGLSLDPEKYNENVGQSGGPGVALVFYAIMGLCMLQS
jgi:rhamnogalacturonyl hydrolase YesR